MSDPLRIFQLYDDSGCWLVIGNNAVTAAKALIRLIGGNKDVNRFSVGGEYQCEQGQVIDLLSFWPHFTNDPKRSRRII